VRKLLATFLLTLCLGSTAVYGGNHTFQTGKLIDVTTNETLDEGTSYSRAIFTVQIGDIVYTLKGERIRRRTKDYAEGLIVGDPVQASIEGQDVFLEKPDGKVLKTFTLKRERVQMK
jgi:hypothetical protein